MEKRLLTGILVLIAGWLCIQNAYAGETTVMVSFSQDEFTATEIADSQAEQGTTGSGGGCFVGSSTGGTYSPTVYHLLNIDQNDVFMEGVKGAPFLPVKVVKVLIPFNATFEEVVVADRRSTFLGRYHVLPTQAVIRPEETAPFTGPDPKYYSLTEEYPAKPVVFGDQGSMRGYQIVTLKVFPLQYIPAADEVFLNEELTLTVRWETETATDAQRMSGPNHFQFDPAFAQIVRDIVSNPEEEVQRLAGPQAANWASTSSDADDVEYLVITDDTLTDAFQPLLDWKTKKGVPASILTTADIYAAYTGADNQQKIKSAIQDYVQNKGTLWVLLGGDDTVVPDRDCYGSVNGGGTVDSTIPTDLYYASLDYLDWNGNGGNACETTDTLDMEYDVFVGRAPVRNSAQAAAFVNKSIAYDKTPPQSDFVEKMLLMGTELWSIISGHSDAYWKSESMYENYIFPNWDGTRYQFYDTATSFSGGAGYQLSPTNVSSQLNSGYNFAFMATHGNWSIWAMESPYGYFFNNTALNLANGQRQGHVYTIACITSKFDGSGDPSLAEAFLRSETGGAVSYIGSARYGWGYSGTTIHGPSFQYADSFYQNLFTGQPGGYANRLGAVFSAHKQDHIASSAYYGAKRWLQFALNLMGDPELYVHTQDPQTLNVSHPAQLTTGSQTVTIDAGVSGLLVCLSKGGEVYATGQTDAQGVFAPTIAPVSDGVMTVTVSGANYIAYEGEVDFLLIPGPPTINAISDVTVNDDGPYTGAAPTLSQGTFPVSWTLEAGPAGMNIDANTGVVSWNDPVVGVSPYTVTIRAENGEGFDDETWSLSVRPAPANLAAGMPVSQSSTAWGGTADRAVDGNTDGDWFGNSVTSTGPDAESEPWWEVDILSSCNIQDITIYKRTDANSNYMSNFYILVSDQPFQSTDLDAALAQEGVFSYYHSGEANQGLSIPVGRTGRYVRLQKTDTSFVQIAEIVVWGTFEPAAPVIEEIANSSIRDGAGYAGPAPSLSQGSPTVTWSLQTGPAGMTINPTTGVLSWDASTINGSPHEITIRAENDYGFDDETWTLTVTPAPANLALNMPASQSSTAWGGSPDLAVDGNPNGDWFGNSITSTGPDAENEPWWEVDLLSSSNIQQIIVHKRTDANSNYMSNFYLLVSDQPFQSTDLDAVLVQEGVWSYYHAGEADLGETISVGRTGQYVRLQKPGSTFVQIAELEIWGEPNLLPPTIDDIVDDTIQTTGSYVGPTPGLSQGTAPITWSLQVGPAGMAIDQTTGVVSWPNPTVDGSPYTITIRSLNSEGYDDESWLLTVTAPPPPQPPLIDDIPGAAVQEGNSYTGPAPVLSQGTSPIAWSLQVGPTGMTIDPDTGVVSWSPAVIDGSGDTITIRAENSEGYDDESWTITVTAAPTEPTNIAVGKPAAQSTTAWGGTPDRAVDGNPNGDWSGNSVTSTGPEAENQPWWQVDLSTNYEIDQVILHKRTDTNGNLMRDFHVLVSDQPFQSTDLNTVLAQEGVWSHYTAGEAGPGEIIPVGRSGRYVRVQLSSNSTYLQLAELEVWGMLDTAPPLISEIPDGSTSEGFPYAGPSPVLTQGAPTVTWSILDGPADMTIDGNTGIVSWDAPLIDVSAYNITVRAENAYGYDDESWLLTVTEGSSEPANVALGKTAAQSSTAWNGTADRAVDGNTDGNWFGNSVTSTGPNTEYRPWWQVDLSASYQIQNVRIFKRTDTNSNLMSDFYILVSDQPFQSTDLSTVLNQEGVSSYYHNGEAEIGETIAIGRSGRYVRIQLTGAATYLQIAELEVWALQGVTPGIISLNQPAVQSTTAWNGTADRAVDGDTNGDWFGASVTSTGPNVEYQPWWEVDLSQPRQIQKALIYKRTDTNSNLMSDFYILVSDQPFQSDNLNSLLSQDGVSSYYHQGEAETGAIIPIGCSGRYVRIQLTGTATYLQIAELTVWGFN